MRYLQTEKKYSIIRILYNRGICLYYPKKSKEEQT